MRKEDEFFCSIQWSVHDLEELFVRHNIPFTEANIDKFLETRAPRILIDETIQQGWEILDKLVFDSRLR